MKIDKILHENHINLYKLNYANEKNLQKYNCTFCCFEYFSVKSIIKRPKDIMFVYGILYETFLSCFYLFLLLFG